MYNEKIPNKIGRFEEIFKKFMFCPLGWGFRPQPLQCSPLRGPSRISNLSCFHIENLMPYGVGTVMVLVSNVTAPVCANALPSSVAPVAIVIDANARMFPLKTEYVPRVAELPTCQ